MPKAKSSQSWKLTAANGMSFQFCRLENLSSFDASFCHIPLWHGNVVPAVLHCPPESQKLHKGTKELSVLDGAQQQQQQGKAKHWCVLGRVFYVLTSCHVLFRVVNTRNTVPCTMTVLLLPPWTL